MQIGVLGISHKSASLELREQVTHVSSFCSLDHMVILKTCNRWEIYFSGSDLAEMQQSIFAELKKRLSHSCEHAFYSFFGEECFYHLACVTAGIDSKLLAESDIQRQVKESYEAARVKDSLPSELHYLFQKALKLGKDARSQFPLFQSPLHLEGMVYQIVHSILNPHPSLLFIGNSELNRKIIHYFHRKQKGRITLVSRDLKTAPTFERDYGILLKDRKEIKHACFYDGVISATDCGDDYLIASLPSLRHTQLILDLSVPRTVNPLLGMDPSLTLMNMEQIGELFAHAHTARHNEVEQVKEFLLASIQSYSLLFSKKNVFAN